MSDTTATLKTLRDRLIERGLTATGPHRGSPSPEWDYIDLPAIARHVHVKVDSDGYWQALVYEGSQLVRMCDPDAGDWPGDPV